VTYPLFPLPFGLREGEYYLNKIHPLGPPPLLKEGEKRGLCPLSKTLPLFTGRLRGVKPLFYYLPLLNIIKTGHFE
jgi:hypothetical protein